MARLEFEITGNIAGLSRAVTQATSLLNRLNQAGSQSGISAGAQAATNSINGELGVIQGLQRALSDLNKQRIGTQIEADLPRLNAEIQATEQEISRLNNAGRTGFDSLGNAIQSATRSAGGFTSGLRGSFGLLRQIAYILPGIGIAGIFNLAFLGLEKLGESLTLFADKSTVANLRAIKDAGEYVKAVQEQKKAIDEFNQSLGTTSALAIDAGGSYAGEIVKLDLLFSSIQSNTKARYENGTAISEIQKLYPDVFGSLKENEFLTNKAALAYNNLRDSIVQAATVQSAIKLAGKSLEDNISATVALQGATDKANSALDIYNNLTTKRKGLQDQIAKTGDPSNALTLQLNATTVALNKQLPIVQDLIKTQQDFQGQTTKSAKEVTAYFNAAGDAQKKLNVVQPVKSGILFNLEEQLKQLQAIRPTIKIQADLDVNTAKIKSVQDQIDKLGGAKGTKNGPKDITESLSQQLDDILRKTNALSAQSGLTGYQLQVQKINDEYRATLANIDKIAAKAPKSEIVQSKANTDINAATKLRDKQQSDAAIAEAQRVQDEIQRINDEFGVKSQTGRDKELASIQKMYDAEVVKAAGNAEILKSLDADRIVAIQAIADKYEAIQADLYDKINTINDTANAQIAGKEESQTQKIINEWEARRKAANKYYDELIKLNAGNDIAGNAPSVAQGMQGITAARLENAKSSTGVSITKAESSATSGISDLSKLFNKTFDQSIKQLGNTFSNTFQTIGQEGNRSITDIFSNLQKDLSSTLTSTFIKFGTDYLGDALKKGITGGTGNLSDIFKNGISTGVGAGLIAAGVGSLVSSLTPKTSSLGQGAGGALTGAATGFLVGGPVGAAVGGGLGLIGGLFGAKSARKKEQQLQEQQLAEAQKQTALLRQQALAYTSSIIGKMTTAGIITGVDINSSGQLTATVSGKDLQFVLDRNGATR